MASRPSFTAKQLFTGIFRILHSMEPKAKQINPSIREDLRRVELSITNSETLEQVNEKELQAYKAIVDEIFGKKIDVTRIDTSAFEDKH